MLESLHISNYALIDSIDIEFGPGLNVITGETGAGKSIILGALSQILGGRADSKTVANPEKKSVIEAVFSVDNTLLQNIFSNTEIDRDESGKLILRRELTPSGRSRAFVNDTPVQVAKLRELAINLVDIHSQHQNLLLADPRFQLNIIDNLAGNEKLLEEYRSRYSELRNAMRSLKRMKQAVEASKDDEDFLRFQLDQLEKLNLVEGEQEELEQERDTQTNLTDIKTDLTTALNLLGYGEVNALGCIDQAIISCERLENIVADDDILQRLDSLKIELGDIVSTLAAADRDLDADPDSLQEIESRLEAIYSAQRRYKVESVSELIAHRESLKKRLDLLENGAEEIATLEKAARRALSLAKECASRLTEARTAAAKALGEELVKKAMPLGMKNIKAEIRVSPADIGPEGADKVEFLFAFNKNQEPMPVGETASGGEISRLMLSLKAIIADHVQLPSLILDEIDTGVSGDVARRMGELMLSVSENTQVITITHLPQVAAKGTKHFKVYKEDDETATHTHIKQLTGSNRVDELAIMLSGKSDDKSAIQAAISLLN